MIGVKSNRIPHTLGTRIKRVVGLGTRILPVIGNASNFAVRPNLLSGLATGVAVANLLDNHSNGNNLAYMPTGLKHQKMMKKSHLEK